MGHVFPNNNADPDGNFCASMRYVLPGGAVINDGIKPISGVHCCLKNHILLIVVPMSVCKRNVNEVAGVDVNVKRVPLER